MNGRPDLAGGYPTRKNVVKHSNKEGQLYNAWLQMDFKQTENNGNYKIKQFHQNYGFDLEKSVEKLPIKELQIESERSRLLQSLQKGNRQAVTFVKDGQEQKHFIEASPQFKSVTVYDGSMHRVSNRQSKSEDQQQSASRDQSVKKDDTKKAVAAESDTTEKKQTNSKKASNSKGMSVG